MGEFKFFKNLLHLSYVNMYKQDFLHSPIHLVKAVQSSDTKIDISIQRLYYRLIKQNIEAREVLKCCFLCIFLKYKVVLYIDLKK